MKHHRGEIMPIIIDSYPQRSKPWFAAILGNIGASKADKIITASGAPSKQAEELKFQLASELISGIHEETYQSKHMKRGLELEDDAIALFEMVYNIEARRVALVYKDEHKRFHCSPDSLIGENAGLEAKCLMGKNHIKYLLANKLPTEFFVQIQMSLYTCEREFWFLILYCPGISPLIIKVYRNEPFIKKLSQALAQFHEELMLLVRKLKGIK